MTDAFDQFFQKAPEYLQNPFPLYRQMRAMDPVHWDEMQQAWVLTRYRDCAMLLRDPRFSSQSPSPILIPPELSFLTGANTQNMLVLDPPDHTRLRKLVSKAFTPRAIEGMRDRISTITDELLDAVQDKGHMEVMEDFAVPLPLRVIAAMMDLPIPDLAQMKRWADDVTVFFFTEAPELAEQAQESALAIAGHLLPIIMERRTHPGDDLLSTLVTAQERGDVLNDIELLSNTILILNAGHETTANLIGNGLLALLRHPGQLQQLHDDPSLIPTAIEELLRYDSPVQVDGRNAAEDLEIDGHAIKKGQFLYGILGSANHDPAEFTDPDALDIRRTPNKHIAFGMGIHLCLGAPLARLEGQIAFETLLRRFPKLELATDTFEWHNETLVLRGLRKLPVVF